MTSSATGLGRGLAAILTGPTAPSASRSIRDRLTGTALDTLEAGGARRLCGYVHDAAGSPDVFLRSPDLRALEPTTAYHLFAAVSDAARRSPGTHRLDIDTEATAVVVGWRSHRGVFFFGGDGLEPEGIDRLASFCTVYTPVLYEHSRPADDDERVHLVLEQQGTTAHAEVVIGAATGFGSAPSSHDAIASATLAAVSTAKLTSVGEVRGDDGAAAFVVAAGEAGRLQMSAAPIESQTGPATAVAVAALRAGRALQRS